MGKLFADDKGNLSLMRVMSFLAFIAGVVRIFMKDPTGGSILLGLAFTGKVTQKIAER